MLLPKRGAPANWEPRAAACSTTLGALLLLDTGVPAGTDGLESLRSENRKGRVDLETISV